MLRQTVWVLAAVAMMAGTGCKGPQRPPTPTSQDQDRHGFEWEHTQFRLHALEAAQSEQPDQQREMVALRLKIADLDWRMDTLPYVDYHTRRRDLLKGLHDQELGWRKKSWSDDMQVDRVYVRLLKEREILHDISRETYVAARDSFRGRLADATPPGARESVLRAFDLELAD